jgi:hypothetical protein
MPRRELYAVLAAAVVLVLAHALVGVPDRGGLRAAMAVVVARLLVGGLQLVGVVRPRWVLPIWGALSVALLALVGFG